MCAFVSGLQPSDVPDPLVDPSVTPAQVESKPAPELQKPTFQAPLSLRVHPTPPHRAEQSRRAVHCRAIESSG
jgi:hypothetical protein